MLQINYYSNTISVPAAVARFLKLCAAETKGAGSITGGCGRLSDRGKKQERDCVKISAHVKDPVQMSQINPEPSATARLQAQVQLRHVEPPKSESESLSHSALGRLA